GTSPRCWWCGCKITDAPQRANFTLFKKTYDTLVCSNAHEQDLTGAYRYVQKFMPVFWIGILGGLACLAFGRLVPGLFIFAFTLIVCPFATPQTVLLLGLRKSFRLGRIFGTVILLGAFALLLAKYLK